MFSLRSYVALLRTWRRRCFHGINAMILCRQISDVIANENARYKRNELEYSFETEFWYIYVLYWINLLLRIFFFSQAIEA